MRFTLRFIVFCSFSVCVFSGPNKISKAQRTVKITSNSSVNLQEKNQLPSVVYKGQKCLLVPEKLMGRKLNRYFTGTSTAAVVMSCCRKAFDSKSTQVHRRCLQEMFHSSGTSNKCPGCKRSVSRAGFAASRSNYLDTCFRKKVCDCCHKSLGSKLITKK